MDTVAQRASQHWHWLEADLHCLQCGRSIGRLVEAVSGVSATVEFSQRAVFCPAESRNSTKRLRMGEQLRCLVCGGSPIISNVERFTTHIEATEPTDPSEPDSRRRGRPPKPMRTYVDPRLSEVRQY